MPQRLMGQWTNSNNHRTVTDGRFVVKICQGCTVDHKKKNPYWHARTFLHWLIPFLFPCLRCIYMQECSVHQLVRVLFPWVQCQSLKPVLSQCRHSQTGLLTVDIIALYTRSYIFHSHGCNKFLDAKHFLPSLIR